MNDNEFFNYQNLYNVGIEVYPHSIGVILNFQRPKLKGEKSLRWQEIEDVYKDAAMTISSTKNNSAVLSSDGQYTDGYHGHLMATHWMHEYTKEQLQEVLNRYYALQTAVLDRYCVEFLERRAAREKT